ncbi:MAG: tRNA lysidine(34) synthetase TilS [Phyllobacteriaceae bacterium]|nr:tRNA lysidine(34) synthetase TilS [Phyllobacteriaceae bacterium]
MSGGGPPSGFAAPDLAGEAAVAVAVSGGGDSTALLLAVHEELSRANIAPRLIALTVDHGLRPDSAAEARSVAALCARLGLAHRTLGWTGPKPRTGVADAARLARHRLLSEAARAAGARIVLTGHTADDQAETVAMRGQRGAGPGMAGIAPATLFARSVWFVRPLIAARRDDLRSWLAARGAGWIDDPSNIDPARERARARAMLARSGETDRLIAMADAAGVARRALMDRAAALIDANASTPSPGLARLDPALFADAKAATEALRLVAACVGGLARPPGSDRTETLVRRVAAGESLRATLGRCVIDASAKGVFLHREWRDGGPAAIDWVAGAAFDGRFQAGPDRPGLRIAAAGDDAVAGNGRLADAAARAEPVDRQAGLVRLISPFALFLPDFDIAAANALARLFDAPPFPPSPWRSRNGGVLS